MEQTTIFTEIRDRPRFENRGLSLISSAGILRIESARTSIEVQSQLGEQFAINFLRDAVPGELMLQAAMGS
jgi:hypothetical protein